ncbi:hypothetical protein FJZ48_00520 [Candidatus Uhrbacteria bacterium]|nr:hypothetical protein [Candidatus Uhrbacteria bacterium]
MSRRHLAFMLSCSCALVLFGFGCKKSAPVGVVPEPIIHLQPVGTPVPLPKATPPSSATPEPKKPNVTTPSPQTPPAHDDYSDQQIIYLRKVMANLNSASSFRADLTIPSDDNVASGTIEFVRSVGLHGLLSIGGSLQAEVYIVGADVLFRSNTSTWTNIGNTTEGAQVKQLFQSTLSGTDQAGITISETARFSPTKDDPSGCRLYSFTQYTPEGNKLPLKVCVKNDLPVSISSPAAGGTVEIRYRDFNQWITISPPKL